MLPKTFRSIPVHHANAGRRNVVAANLSMMHRVVADRLGPRIALRSKRDGTFRDLSWSDYRRRADRAAAGLIARGVGPGDRVGLLAENSVEWLTADIAVLAAGAVVVPLHAPSSPAQVAFQLRHSGARVVIVSHQGQAAKVLAELDALPDLELLIAFGAVDTSARIEHLSWEALIHRGLPGPRLVPTSEARIGRDDLATIIYTSGTTGDPKGVMLTHGNLLASAESTLAYDPLEPDDVLLSWLPYSHIYARTIDHVVTILAGVTVVLADSPETVVRNLAETQPTLLTAVPRFYQKVWQRFERLSAPARAEALRSLFGSRIRRLSSGGAPLPKYVARGFAAAGLPILEGYGLTETAPVVSFNTPRRFQAGSVGTIVPGVDVRLDHDGEVLVRGPNVMRGYWKDEEATRAAIVDGWFHTGDVGRIDDQGFLTITGRTKDLIITSGGKNIAPAELEHLLTRDELIEQAVVCGDGQPFVSALIVPHPGRLRRALGPSHGPLLVVDDVIEDPEARALMEERVDLAMRAVSRPERVREFVLLARPFQVETGELTATMKVRRRHVIERYAPQLDALYASHAH